MKIKANTSGIIIFGYLKENMIRILELPLYNFGLI
jgi:hypothetical protein